MATNNSANQKFTNNADGFDLGGGNTSRKLTVTGADQTLTGSGSAVLTLPSTSDTLVGRATTDTLTNKRVIKRVQTVTQSATPAINTDSGDIFQITGLAQAITSMSSSLTGSPQPGEMMIIQITDNATARAITWGASFASSGTITLPTTTVLSVMLTVGFMRNNANTVWNCVAVV